ALIPPPVDGAVRDRGEAAGPEVDVSVARPTDVDALEVGGARPDNELEQRLPAAGEAQPPAGGAVYAETGEGRRLLGDELGAGRIRERLKHLAHRVERRAVAVRAPRRRRLPGQHDRVRALDDGDRVHVRL